MRRRGPARRAAFFIIALVLIIFIIRVVGERGGGDGGGDETLPDETTHDVSARAVTVVRVTDGDTVVLRGGEKVRYVGVDTPERGEPFYGEARERNKELLRGGDVTMEVCAAEPTDKYGRTLAWVYSGGVDVGGVLVREGLAGTLSIPPCGERKSKFFKEYEDEAKAKGLGVWGGGEAK